MAPFSVYDFAEKGVVSIWVAIAPLNERLKKYFEEHYGRDEDELFTQFSEDFGFGYFDHDSVDTNGSEGKPKSIAELLGQCSFSSSYLREAVSEAERRGLDKSEFVFLLYDIQYDPERTQVSRTPCMEFIGSFGYDSEAPSALPLRQ